VNQSAAKLVTAPTEQGDDVAGTLNRTSAASGADCVKQDNGRDKFANGGRPTLEAATAVAQFDQESAKRTAAHAAQRRIPAAVVIEQTSQRLSAIDSLLYGQCADDWRLRDIASYVGLPAHGPYVVIAAAGAVANDDALPEIESKMRSLDVYSAWRRLADLQVGIAHVGTDQQLDKILALLNRTADDRVGVSAPFDDLHDVPHAAHCAKLSLRGDGSRAARVVVFDGSLLATAAVSAPGVMVKSAAATLGCFADLPAGERETLFETFWVWLDNAPSMDAAADLLFCHPNTVRYRLRRIEQCTGRSLSRPRDVAELCLAVEVHRRLL
jgi:hypothetical protein